ncbi:predicted protein [Naegleria gruberi]|uniref:Predicted protein n=1 Tax=Naegleria gruberi TaxID=5762 RepID=D2VG79_NAEGR|nr:uncharacterized protein NAEGRDRAFT_49281 [Naegleria gruberi]EFC44303.1 predicted protein [Naegleria gruberi]|eukprot:XP_002677047.1 predicted protein [Naegleria gruberi strain NEG-M]
MAPKKMVKKRKEEKSQKTLASYFGTAKTINNPASSSRDSVSNTTNNNNANNRSSSSTSSTSTIKRKSLDSSLTKSPSSAKRKIIDDPIEVDDEDDDILMLGNNDYHFKPLSSTFNVVRKISSAPKSTQIASLAFTPVGCTCVYPYHSHYSHDQIYQHAIRKAQPPTTSQLFYRKLTGIPLSKHVGQVYERQETQNWFKNKPSELARLVDMADTQATEYVTCMDVCGNSMVYGTHKGNVTMCSFVDRERYFRHSFYDARISNVRINPYFSDELSVSTLSSYTGALCLFDMTTGKIKSTVLNDSVLDFENRDMNTLILSKKSGKLDIIDVRTKNTKKIPVNVPMTSSSSAASTTTASNTANSSIPKTTAQGVSVLVPKKSAKKKTTIHNTSAPMFYSDPFDCISIDKNDSNYIYASSFHSMDLKIFDIRKSMNDSVRSINVSSSVQELNNRLEKSIINLELPVHPSINNEFRTETGLQITEVTQLFRGPKQKFAASSSAPSKGIKSFGTTKSGYIHFLTTSGGVGLLDPLTRRVSKFYEDSRSFSLGSFNQKGDVIESDNGLFVLAPYGTSVAVLDWSRPNICEWETVDNVHVKTTSHK